MKRLLTALLAATVIGTTALAFSSTADAQWGYRGGFRGGFGGYGFRGGYGGGGGYGFRGGYGGYGYGGGYGAGYGAIPGATHLADMPLKSSYPQ